MKATAFFGEAKLKAAVLDRLREHQRLDKIVQRAYFTDDGKGCHLGCLTHQAEDTHDSACRMFGFDRRIPHWLEVVFEGLPLESAKRWVVDSIDAIPVGADLSLCHHELAYWLLGDSGLLTIADVNREAIAAVRAQHDRARQGETVSDADWSAARSAAWSAAESAESAAWSAAWSAAESAAWSAAWSAAESAARSAAWSAAESAARSAAWEAIAAKSIEIFRAAPVAECEACESAMMETMEFLARSPVVAV